MLGWCLAGASVGLVAVARDLIALRRQRRMLQGVEQLTRSATRIVYRDTTGTLLDVTSTASTGPACPPNSDYTMDTLPDVTSAAPLPEDSLDPDSRAA